MSLNITADEADGASGRDEANLSECSLLDVHTGTHDDLER